MDSLVSRMHHLIAPVSVSLHFPRGLSKRDRRERLCFEGKKRGGEEGKYEFDYDAEKESLSFFLRFLRIAKPWQAERRFV